MYLALTSSIAVMELGDKTQLTAIALGLVHRGRTWRVLTYLLLSILIVSIVNAILVQLLLNLPHQVQGLFELSAGIYLAYLLARSFKEVSSGAMIGNLGKLPIVFTLMELGDKTQITSITLGLIGRRVLEVFLATFTALTLVDVLSFLAASQISSVLTSYRRYVITVAAVALISIALYCIVHGILLLQH